MKRDDPCINNNIVTAVQRKVDVPSAPMWMDDNANEKIINSSTGDNGSNYGSTASSSPWTT